MRLTTIALLLCGQALLAQDLSVHRVTSTPGPWKDASRDLGYSASFTKPVSGSTCQLGVRLGFSQTRDSASMAPCINCLSIALTPQHIRLRTTELVLLFLPYATNATRVEFGMGRARFNFSGYLTNQEDVSIMTLGLSRRIMKSPVWATAGYAMYGEPDVNLWPQDAPGARTPETSLRFGLLLRR